MRISSLTAVDELVHNAAVLIDKVVLPSGAVLEPKTYIQIVRRATGGKKLCVVLTGKQSGETHELPGDVRVLA